MRSPHDREILKLAVPALGALASEPLYVLALLGSFLVASAVLGRVGAASLGAHQIVFQLFIFLAHWATRCRGCSPTIRR